MDNQDTILKKPLIVECKTEEREIHHHDDGFAPFPLKIHKSRCNTICNQVFHYFL